ncbi:MAG TPA: M50 family metallopeptidase, partial [Nitrososphaerales archaeon]
VGSGAPAAVAGVKPGDIITQVNGVSVTDLNSVLGSNTTLKAGQFVNLTVYRNGNLLQFTKVQLACCFIFQNLQTKQNISYPYIGVSQITKSDLSTTVSKYVTPLDNPWQYVCIPTLPVCQARVPFSDSLGVFYSSPLGSAAVPLANLLYWFFFLNFNLAIFNALPIYPLDGGQAFAVGVKALGRGKMTEATMMRITGVATVAVITMLFGVIAGPYLYNIF